MAGRGAFKLSSFINFAERDLALQRCPALGMQQIMHCSISYITILRISISEVVLKLRG